MRNPTSPGHHWLEKNRQSRGAFSDGGVAAPALAKNRGTPSKMPIFSKALHTNDRGPALLALAVHSGGDANLLGGRSKFVGTWPYTSCCHTVWARAGQLDSRSEPGCDHSLQDQLDEAIM